MAISDALKRFPIVEATYRVFCNGVIVWHDYRPNIQVTHHLRVPEALDCFAKESGRKIYHVVGTTCAIHWPRLEESPSCR